MWMARLLVFGPAVAVIAAAWLLWQGWTRQPEWRAPDSGRDVVWLHKIDSLEQSLRDPAWSWLWRGQVTRQLLRVDAGGRIRPDLVRAWRSYQTTRLFFVRAGDAQEAEQRLRDLGAERWVAWGLSDVTAREDELRVRFDRANQEAAAEVVDLMVDLSLIPLTRMRVSARDHAEQLAREFIQEGTETPVVKALWLDGFEAFEMILAGGSDRVGQEMELRLAARPGLVPEVRMTAHGRRFDEMVLEMDLDPQASWHDGTPFTSADVMELTDRWRAGFGVLPEVMGRLGGEGFAGPGVRQWPGSELFRRIMAWEQDGEHRVSVRFWEPRGSLVSPWTEVPMLRITRAEDGSERILGCGPVEVRQWREGDRVVIRSRASEAAPGGGQNPLDRMMAAAVPEVQWRQSAGSDTTVRRAQLGLVGAVEVPGPQPGQQHQSAFFEKAQWQEVDSRCQSDWWLVWRPAAAPPEAAQNGAAPAGVDEMQVRRWLTALIDPVQLAEALGNSFRPLRPWWHGEPQQGGGADDDNGPGVEDFAEQPLIKVILDVEAGHASGRELRRMLALMWQEHGVEVESELMDGGTTTKEADNGRVVLRARLVRLRPDDALAWAVLWHGPARLDGGDARMDELLKQLGEALEDAGAQRSAESIHLRVQRLGWGLALVREGRRFLLAPDWLSAGAGVEPVGGQLRSLLFGGQEAMSEAANGSVDVAVPNHTGEVEP